jgi:AcrR family transcriptional regulator
MKKSITKEQIIETALDLLKDKNDIRNVNMREIARVLGCAHTNIYNYFPSYNDLLWEAHLEIENKFIKQLSVIFENAFNHKDELYQFFFSLSEFYLDHEGWFRLVWLDYIDDVRPERDKNVTKKVVNTMVTMLEAIWLGIYPTAPTKERIYSVLHNVHCYIIGEVSNYLNGRTFIQDNKLLKKHITETSITFFTLSLKA